MGNPVFIFHCFSHPPHPFFILISVLRHIAWGKGISYDYKRGWALGLGFSLNQAALCYTQRLTGLTVLQPVEGFSVGLVVCVL